MGEEGGRGRGSLCRRQQTITTKRTQLFSMLMGISGGNADHAAGLLKHLLDHWLVKEALLDGVDFVPKKRTLVLLIY